MTYKGHPLRRVDNLIYYGTMAEKYIIMMQILNTKKEQDMEVATKVSIQLQLTDPDLKSRDRVVKKSEKDSLYAAMDIATVSYSHHPFRFVQFSRRICGRGYSGNGSSSSGFFPNSVERRNFFPSFFPIRNALTAFLKSILFPLFLIFMIDKSVPGQNPGHAFGVLKIKADIRNPVR